MTEPAPDVRCAKRVLIIAFNFPPMLGTSAAQRTLSLCRYLPDRGWQPLVLCPRPSAYPHSDPAQLEKIPPQTVIRRTWALDVTRHLAIRGHHPQPLTLPDRWASWWLSAVPAGLRLIRRYRPQALLSTFPIATAHLIGLSLQRLTGLPWVADFRDVMMEENYPEGRVRRTLWQWIERKTVGSAARVVFTTPGAVRLYAERYAERGESHWTEIGNAFDEGDFAAIEADAPVPRETRDPVTLIHSGILYKHERDPRALFGALEQLSRAGTVSPARLRIVLRGTRHEDYCRGLIEQHGLQGIVSVEPVVPYADALKEMLEADSLLVLQGAVCNNQIPAKIYEYLRTRRPILALTDAAGDTAAVLRQAGIDTIAPLDSAAAIAEMLPRFLDLVASGRAPVASDAVIARHTREARAAQFATVLDEVLAGAR